MEHQAALAGEADQWAGDQIEVVNPAIVEAASAFLRDTFDCAHPQADYLAEALLQDVLSAARLHGWTKSQA